MEKHFESGSGNDYLQTQKAAVNILHKLSRTADNGGPPAWRSHGHCQKTTFYDVSYRSQFETFHGNENLYYGISTEGNFSIPTVKLGRPA